MIKKYKFNVETINNFNVDCKKYYKALNIFKKPRKEINDVLSNFSKLDDNFKKTKTFQLIKQANEACSEDIKKIKEMYRNSVSYKISCTMYHSKLRKKFYCETISDSPYLTNDDRINFIRNFKQKIQSFRRDRRLIKNYPGVLANRMETQGINTTGYFYRDSDRSAGVYKQSGNYLKAYKMKTFRVMYSPKNPKTDDKYVGVELEFAVPKGVTKEKIAEAIYDVGCAKNVYIKYDSSVQEFDYKKFETEGKEVNILAKVGEHNEVISKVCKALNELGAKVNHTCGLHIHLDVRQVNREGAILKAKKLIKAQNLLYSIVPASRSINKYCKKSLNPSDTDKYRGINTRPIDTLGTIEVRLHSGTLNSMKINNWIRILHTIMSQPHSFIDGPTPRSFNGWMRVLGINEENNPSIYNYIKTRQERFKDKNDNDSSNLDKDLKEEDISDNIQLALSHG